MAVQLGRILGARVIGTASQVNHGYLRSLGAEPVTYGEGLEERVGELVPEGTEPDASHAWQDRLGDRLTRRKARRAACGPRERGRQGRG